MVITVMFVLMFVLFLLTVPVAVAIGLSSSAALIMIDMPIGFVVQQYFTGLNSFTSFGDSVLYSGGGADGEHRYFSADR